MTGLPVPGVLRHFVKVARHAPVQLAIGLFSVRPVGREVAFAARCEVVVNKVREGEGDFGYNARKDVYEDMRQAGIVDPAKVERVALENAASIAGLFLTTECVLVDKPEPAPAAPAAAPGMGGMM